MTHFLIGEITEQSTKELLAALPHIDTLVLNTCGGDLHCAFALYDALRSRPDIQVIGTGQVASSGILVLLGADRRSATPNTRFMCHPVACEGNAEQERLFLQNQIVSLIAERTGMALAYVQKLMSKVTWFGVKQAECLGLVRMPFC